jgi:hypothetical protein
MSTDMAAVEFCRRCGAELTPGRGDSHVIRIEAFADPFPPIISQEDLARDHGKAMRELMGQLQGYSEQELMDMVHRKMSFFLCAACYREWIEDPTG